MQRTFDTTATQEAALTREAAASGYTVDELFQLFITQSLDGLIQKRRQDENERLVKAFEKADQTKKDAIRTAAGV